MKYFLSDKNYETLWKTSREDDSFKGELLGIFGEETDLESTADCLKVLEKTFGTSDWKRVSKKKFDWKEYRTFENRSTGQVVTVYFGNDHVCVADFDLRVMSDVKDVMEYCQKHFISSGDEIGAYFNPKSKTIFLSCPDAGFACLNDTSDKEELKAAILKWIDEDQWECLDDTKFDHYYEMLYSDEAIPVDPAGFIYIGKLKTFEDLCFSEEDFY